MLKNISFLTLAFFLLFTSCADPENIEIDMDIPSMVSKGEDFIITTTVTNTAEKSQELVSIDVSDKYLEGVIVESTDPDHISSEHIPIDNSVSYRFEKDLDSGESMEVTFYCKAITTGDFSGDFDFCINSDINFLSRMARTVVE